MKFSSIAVVAAIAAPALAFMNVDVSHRTNKAMVSQQLDQQQLSMLAQLDSENKKSLMTLNAFPLKEGQVSNMFEGPTPLVKERDACGVGFIANTSTGGK